MVATQALLVKLEAITHGNANLIQAVHMRAGAYALAGNHAHAIEEGLAAS